MKAAVLTKLHAPLEIKDVYLPSELKHGQVIVRVLCAGICGAQLEEIDGKKGDPSHLPHLLGHEGCGIVTHVGPGVRTVLVGDKVVMHWRKGVGCEAALPVYSDDIKSGPVATFAERVIVSENRVTPIAPDVPDDFAALLGCALSTALATIENVAHIRFGDRVLVVGCGGVGLSLILAAKHAHPWRIVGTDLVDKRLLVNKLGAKFSLGCPDEEFDVIIDTTGVGYYAPNLAPSGRYVMIGQTNDRSIISTTSLLSGEGQTITGTQGGGFDPTRDIPRYVNLWRNGSLKNYKHLISHHVHLSNINDGISLMREGKAARVMVTM